MNIILRSDNKAPNKGEPCTMHRCLKTLLGMYPIVGAGFALLASSIAPCLGAESPALSDAQHLLAMGQDALHGLHTIEYNCRIETTNPKHEVITTETLHYIESPQGYRWERTVNPGPSGSLERSIVAWNGERCMTFDSVTGMVYTKTSAPDVAGPQALLPRGPLEPFAFLRNEEPGRISQEVWPELSGFASKDLWGRFTGRVTSGKQVPNATGQQELLVEAPGGILRGFVSGPTVIRVRFLEEKGLYPVSWEREWVDGAALLVYTIEQFGEAKVGETDRNWRFPAKARIESRNQNAGLPPHFTKLISTDEVRINHTVEEDAFTIDPAIGANIYDLDAGAIIPIPK